MKCQLQLPQLMRQRKMYRESLGKDAVNAAAAAVVIALVPHIGFDLAEIAGGRMFVRLACGFSAGILLALGFMQRIVSLALMVFTALVSVLYHQNLTDPVQSAMFMKNLAIIGGLLLVFAHGYMAWGFKAYRNADAAHRETLAAQERAHAAELRAARAEVASSAASTGTVVTAVDGDGIAEVRPRRWWQ